MEICKEYREFAVLRQNTSLQVSYQKANPPVLYLAKLGTSACRSEYWFNEVCEAPEPQSFTWSWIFPLTLRPWVHSWQQCYDNLKRQYRHKSYLCFCAVHTESVCSWGYSEDKENSVSAATENWAPLLKCIQNVFFFFIGKMHFGLYFFSCVIKQASSWTKESDQRLVSS